MPRVKSSNPGAQFWVFGCLVGVGVVSDGLGLYIAFHMKAGAGRRAAFVPPVPRWPFGKTGDPATHQNRATQPAGVVFKIGNSKVRGWAKAVPALAKTMGPSASHRSKKEHRASPKPLAKPRQFVYCIMVSGGGSELRRPPNVERNARGSGVQQHGVQPVGKVLFLEHCGDRIYNLFKYGSTQCHG